MMVVGPPFWSTRFGTTSKPSYIVRALDGTSMDFASAVDDVVAYGTNTNVNIYYANSNGTSVFFQIELLTYIEPVYTFSWDIDKTGWASASEPNNPAFAGENWGEVEGQGPGVTYLFQYSFTQADPANSVTITFQPTLAYSTNPASAWGPSFTIQIQV